MKREQGTGIKTCELTDEMWEAVQQFVPERKPEFKGRRWVGELRHST